MSPSSAILSSFLTLNPTDAFIFHCSIWEFVTAYFIWERKIQRLHITTIMRCLNMDISVFFYMLDYFEEHNNYFKVTQMLLWGSTIITMREHNNYCEKTTRLLWGNTIITVRKHNIILLPLNNYLKCPSSGSVQPGTRIAGSINDKRHSNRSGASSPANGVHNYQRVIMGTMLMWNLRKRIMSWPTSKQQKIRQCWYDTGRRWPNMKPA